jgi:thiol-disulfide isomerase/thioredoxin
MVSRLVRVAVSGLCLAVLAGGRLVAQADEAGIPVGTTPPPVTIETLDGKPVHLAELSAGKPALIEFWATWCPLCRALEPKLKAAHARYGARVTFLAIAVAVNESPATVLRHLGTHPMPFPYLWDTNGNAVRAFLVPSTSYVVVLDRAGKVTYTGVGPEQDIDGALAQILAAR